MSRQHWHFFFSLAQSVLRAWVGEEEERSSGRMVDGFENSLSFFHSWLSSVSCSWHPLFFFLLHIKVCFKPTNKCKSGKNVWFVVWFWFFFSGKHMGELSCCLLGTELTPPHSAGTRQFSDQRRALSLCKLILGSETAYAIKVQRNWLLLWCVAKLLE